MRLISENSDADLARNQALLELRWPLRDLAANIMRVARGAGRGYEIGQQCVAVLRGIEAFREAVGHYPSDAEISEAISLREGDRDRWDDMRYGLHEIMEGGLQFAASILLAQSTQEAAGRHQMIDGVRTLDKAREAKRRQWQEQASQARPLPRAKKQPKT